MKLGRSPKAKEHARLCLWRKYGNRHKRFAWLPVWCRNTRRHVWLEYYYRQLRSGYVVDGQSGHHFPSDKDWWERTEI